MSHFLLIGLLLVKIGSAPCWVVPLSCFFTVSESLSIFLSSLTYSTLLLHPKTKCHLQKNKTPFLFRLNLFAPILVGADHNSLNFQQDPCERVLRNGRVIASEWVSECRCWGLPHTCVGGFHFAHWDPRISTA